jgi:hypothetical protein
LVTVKLPLQTPTGRVTRSGPHHELGRLLPAVALAGAEVSRLVREAHDLNLAVEPGVREGRNALVRRAVLLKEVLP